MKRVDNKDATCDFQARATTGNAVKNCYDPKIRATVSRRIQLLPMLLTEKAYLLSKETTNPKKLK